MGAGERSLMQVKRPAALPRRGPQRWLTGYWPEDGMGVIGSLGAGSESGLAGGEITGGAVSGTGSSAGSSVGSGAGCGAA